jgi:hypothetical protein
MDRLGRPLGYPAMVRWLFRAAIRVQSWRERVVPDTRIRATHLLRRHDPREPNAFAAART